jgi:hypothetical protein
MPATTPCSRVGSVGGFRLSNSAICSTTWFYTGTADDVRRMIADTPGGFGTASSYASP